MALIHTEKIISAFTALADIFKKGVEHQEFKLAAQKTVEENRWFSIEEIDLSLKALSSWLDYTNIIKFLSNYTYLLEKEDPKERTIAVICAGNVPAVGFHDMLCVLFSGNKLICKLSSVDRYLLPCIAKMLIEKEPLLAERIEFSDGKLEGFDAIIATGNNNSSRYFDYYFNDYPRIIRHSRSSICVLSDTELIDYDLLLKDILTYKGLGCRSISSLLVPRGFDFNKLLQATKQYEHLLNHNKYRNNYDYHKAIYMMNNISFFDSGNLLLLENNQISCPVATLHYQYYDSLQEVKSLLDREKDNLQCITSNIPNSELKNLDIDNIIPIGTAQEPKIDDFADGIDTMRFLLEL